MDAQETVQRQNQKPDSKGAAVRFPSPLPSGAG